VTIQELTQVTSRCNLLAPVCQFSFNSRSARMHFSQVQRVFIVEHYLASRSYLTCQNEFRDTFPDSPVLNKSTVSRLVNRFRDTGTVHRVASNMRKRENVCWTRWTFPTLNITLFFSGFNVIYWLTTCVKNGLREFSSIILQIPTCRGEHTACFKKSYIYIFTTSWEPQLSQMYLFYK
jgi:hypothetical protein